LSPKHIGHDLDLSGSRDHLIRHMPFPIDGHLYPNI